MENGLPEGSGVYYDRNGSELYIGLWKKGCHQLETGVGFSYRTESQCVLYADGMRKYEGGIENGLPEGEGVYYDEEGVVIYRGIWKKGYVATPITRARLFPTSLFSATVLISLSSSVTCLTLRL